MAFNSLPELIWRPLLAVPDTRSLTGSSASGLTMEQIDAIVLTTNEIVNKRQQPLEIAIDGLRTDVRKLEDGFSLI